MSRPRRKCADSELDAPTWESRQTPRYLRIWAALCHFQSTSFSMSLVAVGYLARRAIIETGEENEDVVERIYTDFMHFATSLGLLIPAAQARCHLRIAPCSAFL